MYRGFDTSFNHTALGLASDGSGTLYVSGYTEGSFGGQSLAGSADAYLAKRHWEHVRSGASREGVLLVRRFRGSME